MTKHLLTTVLFCAFCNAVEAQKEPIDTDRPDQTESVNTTPKYYLQIETGFGIEKSKDMTVIIHPTVLWKYGLTKRLELRLLTEVNTIKSPKVFPNGADEFSTGLLPVELGAKLALWEQKNLLPKTSVIGHIAIPHLASKNFKAHKWAPSFILTMQNSLSDKTALGYNIGAKWDGESNIPNWVYTFSPGISISQRCYGYIEAFGSFKKNESPQNSIDGGFAWNISHNAKVDISGGMGLSEAAPDYYFAVGFSFRFNTKRTSNPNPVTIGSGILKDNF